MGFETFWLYIGEDVTLGSLTLCYRAWSGCCGCGCSCSGGCGRCGRFWGGCRGGGCGSCRRGFVESIGEVVSRLIVREGGIFADAGRTEARGWRIDGEQLLSDVLFV